MESDSIALQRATYLSLLPGLSLSLSDSKVSHDLSKVLLVAAGLGILESLSQGLILLLSLDGETTGEGTSCLLVVSLGSECKSKTGVSLPPLRLELSCLLGIVNGTLEFLESQVHGTSVGVVDLIGVVKGNSLREELFL
jgi:hypothetical protein